jgi:uncharacterized protein
LTQVAKPYFKILYNGKDITYDVSRYLLSLQYVDHTEGESDELTITLEDTDELWQNQWYPEKGATLYAEIGIQGGEVLQCGTFEIDEPEMSGPPSIVSIRALAIGIHGKLKTKKGGRNHEGKTLSQIVHTLAATNGYTVQGTITDIRFGRISQNRETDLQFLARLAAEYGHYFSIRGKIMTFTNYSSLESRAASFSLKKTDLILYNFRDKTSGIYKRARVRFHNPERNVLVDYQTPDEPDIETDNDLEIETKAENQQQAEAKAKAALHRSNTLMQSGNITFPGNTYACAGNNVELSGFGKLSGTYFFLTTTHTIDQSSGWICEGEIKRVGASTTT